MSQPVIKGLHHITLCASGAQDDVDFLTQVLGLRLIKQTVLFDGRYAHYRLYTDCSEIKDRNYFHSIYVRSPGGILTECAASVPEGFARDEPIDQLGMQLLLPPWFEHRREEIVAMLEPIVVPEHNRPATMAAAAGPGGAAQARKETEASAASGVTPSRRTSATFIGGDVPPQV